MQHKVLPKLLALAGGLLVAGAAQAQTAGVGIGTTTPAVSALLDLTSTDKGLLIPRMTLAQAADIQNPVDGLLVYRTDGVQPGLWMYRTAGGWASMAAQGADNLGNHTATQALNMNNNAISFGATLGQQLNIFNAEYGIGIQPFSLYFRTGSNFVWYKGGSFSATQNAPGSGGSLQMLLNGNGNLGLGMTDVRNRLDVQGEARLNVSDHATGRALYVTGGFDEASNGIEFRHTNATQGIGFGFNSIYATGSNTTQHLNLMPRGTGGVGIGTTSPAQKLDVVGNVKISGSGNGLIFPDGTKQTTAVGSATPQTLSVSGQTLTISNGNTVTLPVGADNLGNHTATQGLNMNGQNISFGATTRQMLNLYNADYGIGVQGNTEYFRTGDDFAWFRRGEHSNTPSAPGTGGTLQMILNSSGNLGLGVTSPGQKLTVAGQIYSTTGGFRFPDGTVQTTAGGGDNLGNHTATQALNLGTNQLVGNGGTSGLRISSGGAVGIGGVAHASALLDVSSTTQGFLPPRMSQTQRDAIAGPAPGLVVFNTTTSHLNFFDGSYWTETVGTALPIALDGSQSWTVPAGITSVQVDIAGAEGTSYTTPNNVGAPVLNTGGRGGRVQATLAVVPGSVLYLSAAYSASRASTIYVSTNGVSTLALVAGGGGEAGRATRDFAQAAPPASPGGDGGGLNGANSSGGQGGSQTGGGGVGGTSNGNVNHASAQPGTAGTGGAGGSRESITGFGSVFYYGGKGGDGYYGGGGGNPRGGGGGGSSYTSAAARNVIHTQGYQSGNGYVRLTTVRTADAPAISLANTTTAQADGAVLYSDNGKLSGNAAQLAWDKTTIRLGLGTGTPATTLDVNGPATIRGNAGFGGSASIAGAANFGAATRQMINLWNGEYGIGIQGGTQYFRTGEAFAWYSGGSHNDSQLSSGGGTTQMVLKGGSLGIGDGFSSSSLPQGPLEIRRDNASPYMVFHDPIDAWFSFGMDYNDGRKIKITDGNNLYAGTNYLTIAGTNIGFGTTNPSYPIDVQRTVTPGNFAYGWFNQNGQSGTTGGNTGPVSIRATGRIVATEFNATSDRRIKNVIGLSDRAADLELLNKVRITDYTMRDRVSYGERKFKKVIAQEVEEIFPQAVNQHTGFLPDVYAIASEVCAEGDSLLLLTLPKALASPAKPGQLVKLIGEKGEVTATVARPASGSTLAVRGAKALTGQKIFVFGLEHADVRTVDYEALAMLNVSATQELARTVAALEKQNATLRQQAQQQTCRLDEQQAALQTLQTQATAETASLAERLKALENLLGAKAEASR